MADVTGFLIEFVFRILLEAIFEGLVHGLKRLWFWITGQKGKGRETLERHRIAQEARHQNIERIRQRRRRRRW